MEQQYAQGNTSLNPTYPALGELRQPALGRQYTHGHAAHPEMVWL
jgi:hypothetical protein